MRKILALAMMALVALTIAFAVVGCAKKEDTSTTTDQTMPPPEGTMPDTMMSDTSIMAPDTSMSH